MYRKAMHRLILLPLLCVVALAGPRTIAADKTAQIDAYLTAAHNVARFHGAALVAQNGTPIFAKGYGFANIAEQIPNTPEMIYLIGSVTKQFTSAAIMQLQEQGKLSVQDPISKYLPGYPKDPGDRVTIHHLLTHTSGIPSYTNNGSLMSKRDQAMTAEQIVDSFKDKPLDFEPGTKWDYSNSGYFLLGLIIENVSGQSYLAYLQEHIFDPIGMRHTGIADNSAPRPGFACGYEEEDKELKDALRISMTIPFAAGALHSNVGDLLLWDQALYGTSVLSEESKQLMFTPVLNDYAYGWAVAERFGHREIAHGGGIDGFTSQISRYPDDGLTIITFSNNAMISATNLTGSIAAILFDQPYDLPIAKTPVEIDPALLDQYAGVYRVNEGTYRIFRRDGDALFSQRSSGPVFQVYPEAADKFFYENDNATTATFLRDPSGAVIAHIMHQGGEDHRAERITGALADSLFAEPETVEVDPAILADYVGEYELAPGFILTFRTRDDRLFTQATGQSEFEVFPASETEFFLKVVDARVTFVRDESGTVTSLVLRQNGNDAPAPKIR